METGRKTKAAPAHSTSSAARMEAEQRQEVGVRMQTEMVVREDVTIPFGEEGTGTIGMMLDRHLAMLAKEGGEPRSFSFGFDDLAWEKAKPLYAAIAKTDFLNGVENSLRYALEDAARQ